MASKYDATLILYGKDKMCFLVYISRIIVKLYDLMSAISINKLYCVSNVISLVLIRCRIFPFHKTIRKSIKTLLQIEDEEAAKIEKKHLKCMCDFAAEFLHMGKISKEEVKQHMTYKNIELLESILQEGKNVCCYCGHMIGYELFVGLPLWLPNVAMCNFYHAPELKFIDEWMCKRRSRYGAISIDIKNPLRKLLKLKNDIESGKSQYKGLVLGSLADLPPNSTSSSAQMTFFNKSVPFLTGTERVGRKLNATFLYAKIKIKERGYYEIELVELKPNDPSSVNAYTKEFVKELEQNIKEQPELWMMWHSNPLL